MNYYVLVLYALKSKYLDLFCKRQQWPIHCENKDVLRSHSEEQPSLTPNLTPNLTSSLTPAKRSKLTAEEREK